MRKSGGGGEGGLGGPRLALLLLAFLLPLNAQAKMDYCRNYLDKWEHCSGEGNGACCILKKYLTYETSFGACANEAECEATDKTHKCSHEGGAFPVANFAEPSSSYGSSGITCVIQDSATFACPQYVRRYGYTHDWEKVESCHEGHVCCLMENLETDGCGTKEKCEKMSSKMKCTPSPKELELAPSQGARLCTVPDEALGPVQSCLDDDAIIHVCSKKKNSCCILQWERQGCGSQEECDKLSPGFKCTRQRTGVCHIADDVPFLCGAGPKEPMFEPCLPKHKCCKLGNATLGTIPRCQNECHEGDVNQCQPKSRADILTEPEHCVEPGGFTTVKATTAKATSSDPSKKFFKCINRMYDEPILCNQTHSCCKIQNYNDMANEDVYRVCLGQEDCAVVVPEYKCTPKKKTADSSKATICDTPDGPRQPFACRKSDGTIEICDMGHSCCRMPGYGPRQSTACQEERECKELGPQLRCTPKWGWMPPAARSELCEVTDEPAVRSCLITLPGQDLRYSMVYIISSSPL